MPRYAILKPVWHAASAPPALPAYAVEFRPVGHLTAQTAEHALRLAKRTNPCPIITPVEEIPQ